MNRRRFLGVLGLGGLAASARPELLLPSEELLLLPPEESRCAICRILRESSRIGVPAPLLLRWHSEAVRGHTCGARRGRRG